MKNSILPPIHPGEILREEYLVPMEMSAGALAKEIDVPRTRIERLVNEQTSLSTDTALRLAKYFDTSPEFWMNLQASYDLKITAKALEDELALIEAYIEPVRQYA
ncbi:HigA family addiction module antitoxin [Neoaquamicrobium sediminum]|uniref:HigA family addiction module antitoxin n=1 Tax=Neoaquamicrobium sediminum TaxID=1849104 RepID=A0ABV3WSN7_9HYPH